MNLPWGRHLAVIGLGYGDESKGSVIDAVTRDFDYNIVVKSSGGGQCAHHVTREDGVTHRFAQFGSGTFNGALTVLSKYFMVDPIRLAAEADALRDLGGLDEDPYDMMLIDRRCLVTTPYHACANRLMEIQRGDGAHGSCGIGVGETRAYDIETGRGLRVYEFNRPGTIRHRLSELMTHYLERFGDAYVELWRKEFNQTDDAIVQAYLGFYSRLGGAHSPDDIDFTIKTNTVVFEGSQGVLLDEWYGTFPFNTWSTTTFENADKLAGGHDVYHLGVMRSYTTRHGAGPLPTEVPVETMPEELHNGTGRFQGAWRAGHFDAVLMQYAIDVCASTGHPVHGLAVTHLDRAPKQYCDAYRWKGYQIDGVVLKPSRERYDLAYQEAITQQLFEVKPVLGPWSNPEDVGASIEERFNLPVVIRSYGPKASDKIVAVPTWA